MSSSFDRRRRAEPRGIPYDPVLDSSGNPMRPPAPTGRHPERWDDGYNHPMVYDRENYHYAQSQTQPPGERLGPVRWGTLRDRDRTHMNPDHIDLSGAMPGEDYSRARVLGEDRGPSFAGLGPKEYRRSDERIREDVCEALAAHPAIDASDLEVAVRDGAVTLRGTVDDRTSKRLAVDVAESIIGVTDVASEVRTQRPVERVHIDAAQERREDAVARR
jgi:BON domain